MPQNERSVPSLCQTHKHVHVVKHDYHDYSAVQAPITAYQALNSGRNHNAFPYRLYEMLQLVESDGLDHIVSWQPHGRCFVVHKPEEFTAILPRYFKLSKIASFQRQLNLYGFQRLTKGLDRGGYYNECFLRGKEFLLDNLQRVKVKGTGVRAKSNPEDEPDFYSLTWMVSDNGNSSKEVTVNPVDAVVVSDDDDEHSTEDSESIVSNENEEGKICAWGMSFYYMPRTETGSADLWMKSEPISDFLTSEVLETI